MEYDKHGRPIPQQQSATPPHGDPLTGAVGAPRRVGAAAARDRSRRSSLAGAERAAARRPRPASPPRRRWRARRGVAGHAPPPAGAARRPAPPDRRSAGAARAGRGVARPPPAVRPASAATPSSPPVEGVDAAAAPDARRARARRTRIRNTPSYAPPKLTGGDPLAG